MSQPPSPIGPPRTHPHPGPPDAGPPDPGPPPRDPLAALALGLAVLAALAVLVMRTTLVVAVLLGTLALVLGLVARHRAGATRPGGRRGHPRDRRLAAAAVVLSGTLVAGIATLVVTIVAIFIAGGGT